MYFNFNRIQRGRLNESIVNKYFGDISQDILDIYQNMEELNTDAEILKKVNVSHGSMLGRLINTIESRLDAIESGVTTATLYNSDDIFIPTSTNETSAASVDYDFGMATCGIMNSKRIFTSIYDDELILSTSAQDNISRVISNNKFREKADNIVENDILNAFDPQEKQPYVLSVQTNNASFAEAEVILNILNIDTMLNTIKIKPQPLLELNIENLKMATSGGLANFTNAVGDELQLPVQNAENILLTFPEKQVSYVNMTITQNNKTATLPYEFIIGFNDISLEYNEFYNKAYVGFSFTVPTDDEGAFKRLKSVDFNWTYLKDFTRAFIYDNITDANNISDNYIDLVTTDGIIYSQTKKMTTSTIHVVVELNKLSTNTSPMIRSASVQFI